MRKLAFLFLLLFLASCSKTDDERPASNMAAAREAKKEIADLRRDLKKIEPFFQSMGKPERYDWLGSHTEPGQTFEEYLDSDPTKPTKERQTIYVLPLGRFKPAQTKIIEVTAGYLEAFYDLPVRQLPAKLMNKPLATKDFRRNKLTKVDQVHTGYILQDVLKPMLPTDAAALIAFTDSDLYPDDTMSYVFGQASLEDRLGVWSLSRLDDNANYDTFLRRTLKIAVHETGHMFSMRHCTKYECVMSGTNHLGETDRRPIDACPECMAKICWLSDTTAAERYKRLADFCKKNGLVKEGAEFEKKLVAVSN